MSRHLAMEWLGIADRLARIGPWCSRCEYVRARRDAIAMALADAYRQGWSASRKEEVEEEDYEQSMPAVLVRAAVIEFRRTGHWPCDVFERMVRWVDENTPRWRHLRMSNSSGGRRA